MSDVSLEYMGSFSSRKGKYFIVDSVKFLTSGYYDQIKGKVQLLLTSPPFPLNNQKNYGNLEGNAYLEWFSALAPIFSSLLTEDGSLVIEIGNAWEKKRPVQSLLPLQALLSLVNHPQSELRLIQQFICYNPARLPSPAAWVTINRWRAVDSYTNIWWLAKTDFPKADNKKVLRPYSKSMQKLLQRKKYNAGRRPSGHVISAESFNTDHGGAIAHNFFESEALDPDREVRLPNTFSFANTISTDFHTMACRREKIVPHPAKMPVGLAAFFIQFLTDKDDLVLDPFAGSNTTGFMAELLGREWLGIEINQKYAREAWLRFADPQLSYRGRCHGNRS